MSNIEYLTQLKKELEKASNNVEKIKILKNNIPEDTIYTYMKKCNQGNEEKIALHFGKNKITYGELFEKIEQYAKGFMAMGIEKGDRVALLLPNLPESTIIIYALNKIGAISDNIDPTSKPERMKYFLEKEKIDAIICFDAIYEKSLKPIEEYILNELKIDKVLITKIEDSLSLFEKIVYKASNRNKQIILNNPKFYSIDKILKNSRYQLNYTNPYTKDEVATICHSSGSEGIPKTLPSTNENINFISLQHQISEIDYTKVKSFLHILPGFAQFGFSDSMHLGHCLGLEMIEVPIFSHDIIIDILVKSKANCIFGEPSLFIRLATDPKYDKLNLSFLEEVVYGGGRISPTQIEKINKYLISHGAHTLIRTGYGMSEFNGTCILENPYNSSPNSCGKELIGGQGIILDEQKNPVKTGQIGNLYFTKASMPLEVFDDKKMYEPLIIDGLKYVNTGDLMHQNAEGEYFFDSRVSGMISRYDGYKIYPSAFEDNITKNPYVCDAMVSEYYEEEKYGMMPITYIKLNDAYNDDEIIQIINSIIEKNILNDTKLSYKDIPRKWRIVEELPMNSSLKKDYKKIRESSLDGNEYTVICDETNVSLNGYKIISPCGSKKLTKRIK